MKHIIQPGKEPQSMKEKLILAGIDEIEHSGIQEFSLRQVSERCGVSCAAPYKHFRDKQDFIVNIIRYINSKWNEMQDEIISRYTDDKRTQILEVCMGFVRFLVENPHFRAIIITLPKSPDPEQLSERHELSASLKALIHGYAQQLGIPAEIEQARMYVVRSLMYGAAMFIDNRQMQDSDQTMQMVRMAISRELDPAAGFNPSTS